MSNKRKTTIEVDITDEDRIKLLHYMPNRVNFRATGGRNPYEPR